MFGGSKRRRLEDHYAKVIKQIKEGERRKPKHRRPTSVRDGGAGCAVTDAHEVVFADFDWFAAVLNRHISDPWAIEETERTEVHDIDADSPDAGRTYSVYYNTLKMGRLQVTVGVSAQIIYGSRDEFLKNPAALAILELDYLRLVPYEDAHSLIKSVELHLGPFKDADAAHARADAAATAALTAYLWEAVRIVDAIAWFHHRVDGPYHVLRLTTDHWKKNGIDPFKKWSGDRTS